MTADHDAPAAERVCEAWYGAGLWAAIQVDDPTEAAEARRRAGEGAEGRVRQPLGDAELCPATGEHCPQSEVCDSRGCLVLDPPLIGAAAPPDGSLIEGVCELFPGADKQALRCLAALLEKQHAAPRPGEDAGERGLPIERDTLGRMVREAWVRWAQTQPSPKPSWLVPYDDLAEPDKEADRQIGEAVARWTIIHHEAAAAPPPAPLPEADGERPPNEGGADAYLHDVLIALLTTRPIPSIMCRRGRQEIIDALRPVLLTAARADAVGLQAKLENLGWIAPECEADGCQRPAMRARAEAAIAQRDKAVADLTEATAELLYLRQYGKLGALWVANDSKPYWREKARTYLEHAPPHPRDAEGAGS